MKMHALASPAVTMVLLAGCPAAAPTSEDMTVPDLTVVQTMQDMRQCPACTGEFPVCDPSTLYCVACLKSSDCHANFNCMNKKCVAACIATGCLPDGGSCDVDGGTCRGCNDNSECPVDMPRCDDASGRCVPCVLADDNCPTGKYCVKAGPAMYSCVPGCKYDADCFAMGNNVTCCNHGCVDVNTDGTHCGGCNKGCAQGKTCQMAVCK